MWPIMLWPVVLRFRGMGFRMVVANVFGISNQGVVVAGRVESGSVHAGSRVVVERDGHDVHTGTVTAVEFMPSPQQLQETDAGDNAGLLLRDLRKEDLASGDVLRDGD